MKSSTISIHYIKPASYTSRPVTDEERDKALRLASGKEEKPVFDPLMNPAEDEEQKRKDSLEEEKLRVQQEKKEREAERLKEKQVKEEKERQDSEQFMKLEVQKYQKTCINDLGRKT